MSDFNRSSFADGKSPGWPDAGPDGEDEGAWPELLDHLALCREILAALEKDGDRSPGSSGADPVEDLANVRTLKDWSGRLDRSTDRLKRRRRQWPKGRALPEITARLARQNQDLMMKILVMDRDNERAKLKNGAASLAQLAHRHQSPHFVADLYRRNRVF